MVCDRKCSRVLSSSTPWHSRASRGIPSPLHEGRAEERVVKKAAEHLHKFIQPNNVSKAHGQWSETLQSVAEMLIAE